MKSSLYKILVVLSLAVIFVVLPSYYLLQTRFDPTGWRLNLTRVMGLVRETDPPTATRKPDLPATTRKPGLPATTRKPGLPTTTRKSGLPAATRAPGRLNVVRPVRRVHDYVQGTLLFGQRQLVIFVHGKHDGISNSILLHGMWEAHWIYQMMSYLEARPGMQLIDAGCNLGVYTLVAAALGHKVIAIDANKNNTDRLAQSVLVNNLTSRVTIVLNALSNERRTFSMNSLANNVGGQQLTELHTGAYRVDSVFLDDLLPLLDRDKDVMMKMDIQHHEIRALKAATRLFAHTRIRLILIEWIGLKDMKESPFVMEFLLTRHYAAYITFFSTDPLNISKYRSWPYDVVWRRD